MGFLVVRFSSLFSFSFSISVEQRWMIIQTEDDPTMQPPS